MGASFQLLTLLLLLASLLLLLVRDDLGTSAVAGFPSNAYCSWNLFCCNVVLLASLLLLLVRDALGTFAFASTPVLGLPTAVDILSIIVVPPVLVSPQMFPFSPVLIQTLLLLLFLQLSTSLEVMLDNVSAAAAAPFAVKVPSVIGVSNKLDVPAVADIHPVSLDPAVVVPAVPKILYVATGLAVASLLP